MPRLATIENLPMAFEMVRAKHAEAPDWSQGYRPLGRRTLAAIIEGRMVDAVDVWLDELDASAARDRRHEHCRRHLLTDLGDFRLKEPRTRRPSGRIVF